MIYGNLLNNLSQNDKIKYRCLENLNKKLIKKKWSVVFNTTCLNNRILPKYTNYIYIGTDGPVVTEFVTQL